MSFIMHFCNCKTPQPDVGAFQNKVAKSSYLHMLSLQVNWHDFAFFDPVMYESLRQLIRHSQAGEADAVFAAMDLAFAIDLCKEEGAGQVKDYTVIVSPNVDCNTEC